VKGAHDVALLVAGEAVGGNGLLVVRRPRRDLPETVSALRSRRGYRVLGVMMDVLRLLRNHADYELQRPLGLAEARRAVMLARHVAQRISNGQ